MAAGAIGFHPEFAVHMAIAAIKVAVDFIQLQPGDGMFEVFLVPATVAIDALRIQFRNSLPCRMTCPAGKFFVVAVKLPSGGSVSESWLLLTIVALITSISTMAS